MDVIRERVNATPRLPHSPEVVLVVASSYDHIERIAELMSASTGRRCRIRRTPSEIAVIESDLLAASTKGACYLGLDPSTTCKVYKVCSCFLEFWD